MTSETVNTKDEFVNFILKQVEFHGGKAVFIGAKTHKKIPGLKIEFLSERDELKYLLKYHPELHDLAREILGGDALK